jgi:excisionase family DNA binding protein
MEQEPLVDVNRVAEVTGTPVSWWYSAAESNRVPHYRVGKYVRFKLSEVEQWLAAQRRVPR